TTHEAADHHPVWSPDGSKIAFASDRSGNYDIWIVSAAGGEPTQLTFHESDENQPCWSPDGSRIAFMSKRSGTQDIWIAPLSGGEAMRFTGESESSWPSWSPDGTKIAFSSKRTGNNDVWVKEVRDEAGRTPLHWAAEQNNVESVSLLIDKGADVNDKDSNFTTPLHIASSNGYYEIARLLVENGADITSADFRAKTPLHFAATYGFKDIVALLLAHGAPLEVRDSYGRTPLLLCARERGGTEVARLLITAGADINARDNFESTPLELAAWRGYREIVAMLIDNGAEIPVSGRQAGTLLFLACQQGLENLFHKMVQNGMDVTFPNNARGSLLHDAASGGSSEIVDVLIKKGLPIDAKDRYGWTPLHYAAKNGRVDVMETLLVKGAEMNIRTIMGQTAYNIAEEFGFTQIQELLRRRGCDQSPMQFPLLEGDYLGESTPADVPILFAPGIIASVWGLHSSLAFSPDGNQLYWAPMIDQPGQPYSRGVIYCMERINKRWTPPQVAPFSGKSEGSDGEPFFSPNGARLYFNSNRPNPGQGGQTKENIWYVEKTMHGWSEPKAVDQVINHKSMHWQFSVDNAGNLYFASDDAGGFGMQDIYCAMYKNGKYENPVNLGETINTATTDHTPFISPEGDYLIYSSGHELHISFRNADRSWGEAKNLGSPINTGFELCPIVTHDKKYIIFLSQREGESHPFRVSAKIIEELRPKN
ncbi:MAG: ankyrin repeat domain-containing protein, partial [Deltaproteobacteria bacterium]|nr:ankyrin repeat domain-containing protein [Deltaproteobacteria bacterium]